MEGQIEGNEEVGKEENGIQGEDESEANDGER